MRDLVDETQPGDLVVSNACYTGFHHSCQQIDCVCQCHDDEEQNVASGFFRYDDARRAEHAHRFNNVHVGGWHRWSHLKGCDCR